MNLRMGRNEAGQPRSHLCSCIEMQALSRSKPLNGIGVVSKQRVSMRNLGSGHGGEHWVEVYWLAGATSKWVVIH